MNITEFKEEIVNEIEIALGRLVNQTTVSFGEVLNEEDDRISGTVEVTFKYGNCEHKHTISVSWDDKEGFGLEDIDGGIYDINTKEVILQMYYDLAL